MRLFFLFISLSFSLEAFSQSDFIQKSISPAMGIPVKKNVDIPANSNFDKLPESKPKFSNWDTSSPKSVNIIQKDEFVKPGKDVERKLNEKESNTNSAFKSNHYLGDFRNNGAYVKFVCRDFGEVDGDRIRVYLNDEIVEEDIYLDSVYKVVRINLVNGFNKIDFQALNQGSSGPNTAEFKMFDDKGVLISSNQWNLATGAKATLIIVKE
ncbi:MAG: hypothetical protein ACI7YS_07705 [Flavobacterium sp.]